MQNGSRITWTKVDTLFVFLSVWTIVQFTMCLMEFLHWDNYAVPLEMPLSYFLLVMIYVLRKEVDRWLKKSLRKRKGEYFLLGWWLAMLVMFVIEFMTLGRYSVPSRMVETCIWVLIPYCLSALSKILHTYSSTRNGPQR